MKTLFKIIGVLFVIFLGFVIFASNTEHAKFQSKQSALAKHIRSHLGVNRPASYYEWAKEVEAEWERIRADLEIRKDGGISAGVIKETDDFFATLLRDIEKDREKAPDTPQIHPEQ